MTMELPRFRPGDLVMRDWDLLTIIAGPATVQTEGVTSMVYVTESIISKIMQEGPLRRIVDAAELSPYDPNST
jgi:hypothetical protein